METNKPKDIGKILESIIEFNQFKNCVEIGVAEGDSTKHICSAVKKTDGHVYAFDIWARHGQKNQFNRKGSKETVDKMLRCLGHDNFTLTQTDSISKEFPSLLKKICPSIDFAFIDGDHSYDGIKSDYDAVIPLLSSTGIIMFHDTQCIDGCREFVLDLRTRFYDGTYDIIDFPWGNHKRRCGISLMVKRSFPILKRKIDEICGSPSNKDVILNNEQEWYKNELKKYKKD